MSAVDRDHAETAGFCPLRMRNESVDRCSDLFFCHWQNMDPVINSFGYLVVGVLGIYVALTRFDIQLSVPSLKSIKHHLNEGWHVFLSTIAINMYTTTNTFLLGLLTNNTLVGYYSIAEKFITAANGLFSPISQALYPYISRTVHNEDKTSNIIRIRKLTKLAAMLGAIFSLGLFIFADPLISILFGPEYASSIVILRILSIIPFMVSLSNIFGIQTMLTFNYKKDFKPRAKHWATVTGKISVGHDRYRNIDYPIMDVVSLDDAQPPEEEIASFY